MRVCVWLQVQLNTYGMLPLMRIPVLQRFLRRLLTEDLPASRSTCRRA